jgi:hypothetical protein
LLDYYDIKLQHLNPNEIRHIMAFITLCKGFLGIEPHFELWRYFFIVSLYKRAEREGDEESSRYQWVARASIFGGMRWRNTCHSR